VIPKDRVALYCRALQDIGETQLQYAFDLALMHLGDFPPSVETIRNYSEQWQPRDVIGDSRHILGRGDKPPDWEPLSAEEIRKFTDDVLRESRKLAMGRRS
jgi:hypothetical protein